MAKFIGNGTDVRAPEGVDFDVPDADEAQLKVAHEWGDPVDPAEEPERIHAGRAYAPVAEPEGASTAVADPSIDEALGAAEDARAALLRLKRTELDDRAREAGVDNPEGYPNKEALADATLAAEGGSEE